jgi:hypothetical protein
VMWKLHSCGAMRRGAHMALAVVRLWKFWKENVIKLLDDHALLEEGTTKGDIEKILWRKTTVVGN